MIELILMQRVDKLGQMGDLVKVKPGYARNFLLPGGKAIRASKENLERFSAQRAQLEAQNLKRVGDEFAREEEGELTIATTHTQARYALPTAVQAFLKRYPKVSLRIKQGNPIQICEMVVAGEPGGERAREARAPP